MHKWTLSPWMSDCPITGMQRCSMYYKNSKLSQCLNLSNFPPLPFPTEKAFQNRRVPRTMAMGVSKLPSSFVCECAFKAAPSSRALDADTRFTRSVDRSAARYGSDLAWTKFLSLMGRPRHCWGRFPYLSRNFALVSPLSSFPFWFLRARRFDDRGTSRASYHLIWPSLRHCLNRVKRKRWKIKMSLCPSVQGISVRAIKKMQHCTILWRKRESIKRNGFF